MNSRNILIIGGSGFIGAAIARKLAARGLRLVVPTRRRERAKHLITLPTMDVVDADVHDPGTLERLMRNMDAVVSLVGILHGDRGVPYGREFKFAHVDLPRKIAEACVAVGVPRLLHMSALGAAADAPSMYLRSKAAGEAAIREATESAPHRVAVTMFRPSVVFGRDDRFINLFARMQRLLPLIPLGGASSKLQCVHVEDVAQAFANALDNPATFGRTYDLAGPKAYTLREIVEFAGRVSGHPRPVIPLADGIAWLQAWAMEFLPIKLLSRDNLDSLKIDSVSAHAFAPELGVAPEAMEVIAPSYLAGHSPRDRYMQLRDHAGR